MGIFQSRPEEPSEWGGLPAEPADPRNPVELLPPPVDDLGTLGAAGVALSVPIELVSAEDAAPAEPTNLAEPGGEPGSD